MLSREVSVGTSQQAMIKTYRYRLYPTQAQERRLQVCLDVTRNLYNMALEERKLAWEHEQRRIGKYDQYHHLCQHYRRTFPQAVELSSQMLRVPINDLDKSFQAFFRRVKAGEKKPGYPKFKGFKYWDSIGFPTYGNGWRIDGRRLYLKGTGRVSVRWDRPIGGHAPCKLKSCRITRRAGRWYVSLNVEMPTPTPLPSTGKEIGIDVGISALITTSDGDKIDNPKWYREGQAELRRRSRRLARAKRGSKNRRKRIMEIQRQQVHIANQRNDFLEKLTTQLVQDCDLIAIEDLKIKNMVKNRYLSKSIMDAGWGYFKKRLLEKAAEAGRDVILVDPAYTSKTCSNCGAEFKDLTLAVRWVECECGLSMDRDHNAAINILNRARRVRERERSGWVTASVAQNPKHALRNRA